MATPSLAFETTTYEGDETAVATIEAAPEPAKVAEQVTDPDPAAKVVNPDLKNRESANAMAEKMRKLVAGEDPKAKTAAAEVDPAAASETKPEDTLDAIRVKKAADWKLIKDERDNARKESAELKERISKLEAASKEPNPLAGDVESLKKERDEYSRRMQEIAVEQHPKFQAFYKAQMQKVVDAAKAVAPDKSALIEKVFKIADPELRNEKFELLSEDLSPVQQARLGALMARSDEITIERDGEIAKSKENYTKIQAQESAAVEQSRAEHLAMFDKVEQEARSAMTIFKPVEGDEKWNAKVTESLALAKEIFAGNQEPEDLARAAVWAVAGPQLYDAVIKMSKELAAANARISALNGASPKAGAAATAAGDTGSPKTFADKFKAAMAG